MIFKEDISIFDTVLYHFRAKDGSQVLPYDFVLRVHKETRKVIKSVNPAMQKHIGKDIDKVINSIRKDYEFTDTI